MTSCPLDQTSEMVLNDLNYPLLFPVQIGHAAFREDRQNGTVYRHAHGKFKRERGA
jgi:hypothetical protein